MLLIANGKIEMITIIGIILADLVVALLFIYHYRQELGLTVNGSSDKPALPKKSGDNKVAPDRIAEGQAKRGQIASGKDITGNRLLPGERRNA